MPRKYKVKRHAIVQPEDNSIRYIALTKGQFTVVDAVDYEWLIQWNWCALWNECTKTFYAQRTKRDTPDNRAQALGMHSAILDPPKGMLPDHIDGDTLNNRRCNLRVASRPQNTANASPSARNTSGRKGVSFNKAKRKFSAQIVISGRQVHLGYFVTAEEAGSAYDKVALRQHGKFAKVMA